jgi:hypothetical protein
MLFSFAKVTLFKESDKNTVYLFCEWRYFFYKMTYG